MSRPLNPDSALKSFQSIARDAISKDSTDTIRNTGPEKAALLMSEMLNSARQSVFIYAQGLRPEVTDYDVYIEALTNCLNRDGVTVNVLLNSDERYGISEARQLLIDSCHNNPDKIHYYTYPKALDLMHDFLRDDAHFMVVDGKRYRLEYDIANCQAMASMNDQGFAGWLEQGFSQVLNSCQQAL